jgi:hypothetical protein
VQTRTGKPFPWTSSNIKVARSGMAGSCATPPSPAWPAMTSPTGASGSTPKRSEGDCFARDDTDKEGGGAKRAQERADDAPGPLVNHVPQCALTMPKTRMKRNAVRGRSRHAAAGLIGGAFNAGSLSRLIGTYACGCWALAPEGLIPASRSMIRRPAGVPGQCRRSGSGPAERMTERRTRATMITSSA